MKKTNIRIISMLFTLVLCMSLFTVPAFAGGGEDIPQEPTKIEPVKDPLPLTPDGNLTLVDDIEGEQSRDKQFVTVQSKNGNYFYLIIDRADDKENVYFLNLVDEADLLALIEDAPTEPQAPPQCICTDKCKTGEINENCPVCKENKTSCEGKETEQEEQTKPQPKSNPLMLLIVFLVIGGIGGGAFYYFKILKPKQANKGNTNLDEYDYDDEDEDEYGYMEQADEEETDDSEVIEDDNKL